MITALIRTHPGREELTKRAIESADGCNIILHKGEKVNDYSYNLYCNELKSKVEDGFFFFLDSDDFVIPGAVEKIKSYLKEDVATIVPMLRNGMRRPSRPEIKKLRIGMPCLILHSKNKDLAHVTATETGDYDWIKGVTDKMNWQFINIPLVNAGKRSHGK